MIEPLLHAERLLLMGMLDQAEAVYRRTAEQDPRNAIAVMGLARVAVERGEMEEAHAQAARALRIDPENAAAAAMETRTAELLDRQSGGDGLGRRAGGDGRSRRSGGGGEDGVEPDSRTEPAAAVERRGDDGRHDGEPDSRTEPAPRVARRELLRRIIGR